MPSSSLIITELSGRQRTLTLVGPGLPFQGAPWPGEQRLITKYYAGNPEATQQVLGPVDLPSDWSGMWRTTQLLGTPQTLREGGGVTQIGSAFNLYQTVEDIVRAGALLRVTWAASETAKILREGRIGSYSFKPDRADDIAWQLQFVWIGRGGETSKVTPRDESVEVALRAQNQAITDLLSELVGNTIGRELADLPTAEIPTFSLADLISLAETPTRLFSQITTEVSALSGRVSQAVGVIEQVRQTPDQIANLAMISARDTRENSRSIATRISRLPVESYAAPGVGVGRTMRTFTLGQDAHRGAVRAEGQAVRVETTARRAHVAAATGRIADAPGPEDAMTIHVVRAGETYASIARRYYGDPGLGGEIARANRQPRYAVSPAVGARLLIPARPRGSS